MAATRTPVRKGKRSESVKPATIIVLSKSLMDWEERVYDADPCGGAPSRY